MDDTPASGLVEWDERHRRAGLPPVDPWLRFTAPAFAPGLPGAVLDLACGLGQNALWLSRRGFQAVGVDGSPRAVERARAEATSLCLPARFHVVRLTPGQVFRRSLRGPWGAILVFHYLDRALLPLLPEALAPGGVLVYKTHLKHRLRPPHSRPRTEAYLLQPGELLTAFPSLMPLSYREWADGSGAFAGLLARRPLAHSS